MCPSFCILPKMWVVWGVGLEGLVMIDLYRHIHRALDFRGYSTQFKCELGNITLCCTMQICTASAKEIVCYLYRPDLSLKPSHNYPRVSWNDRLVCSVWFQWLPEDIKQLSEMEPVSYIFLTYLVAIHQEKECRWTNGVTQKKIYVSDRNWIPPVVSRPAPWIFHILKWDFKSSYVVEVPSYWTQRLRLPQNGILDKIIN